MGTSTSQSLWSEVLFLPSATHGTHEVLPRATSQNNFVLNITIAQVTVAQLFPHARDHPRSATATVRLHIRMSLALFQLTQKILVLFRNLCHRGDPDVFVVATPLPPYSSPAFFFGRTPEGDAVW